MKGGKRAAAGADKGADVDGISGVAEVAEVAGTEGVSEGKGVSGAAGGKDIVGDGTVEDKQKAASAGKDKQKAAGKGGKGDGKDAGLTVSFELDMNDVTVFHRHFYATNAQARRQRRIIRWGVVALFCALALMFDVIWIRIYFGVFAILWLAMTPRLARRKFVRIMRKMWANPENARLYGRRTVTFGDLMRIVTDWSDDMIRWETFLRAVELPGYLLLYVTENSAIVIPTHKLQQQEAGQVRETIAAHMKL
ncbi:MAG: YcxB family protein [Rikenellaceae bacterium]|jgi:hypothetical protein|nr:YcxB family protein [Rikenellaceae bacterium]